MVEWDPMEAFSNHYLKVCLKSAFHVKDTHTRGREGERERNRVERGQDGGNVEGTEGRREERRNKGISFCSFLRFQNKER